MGRQPPLPGRGHAWGILQGGEAAEDAVEERSGGIDDGERGEAVAESCGEAAEEHEGGAGSKAIAQSEGELPHLAPKSWAR